MKNIGFIGLSILILLSSIALMGLTSQEQEIIKNEVDIAVNRKASELMDTYRDEKEIVKRELDERVVFMMKTIKAYSTYFIFTILAINLLVLSSFSLYRVKKEKDLLINFNDKLNKINKKIGGGK